MEELKQRILKGIDYYWELGRPRGYTLEQELWHRNFLKLLREYFKNEQSLEEKVEQLKW